MSRISPFLTISHFFFKTILGSNYYQHPHFTDEEADAPGGSASWLIREDRMGLE